MKKNGSAGLNVGGASIMMIFVLLCLTTFATLSVVSASADLNLTRKAVASSDKYYKADALAEQKLAEIDAQLQNHPSGVINPETCLESAMQRIRDHVEGVEFSLHGNGFAASYAIPIDENQELRASLFVTADSNLSLSWQRQSWQVYNTGEWDLGDDTLDLWDGILFAGTITPSVLPERLECLGFLLGANHD